jgi:hypothetical protein
MKNSLTKLLDILMERSIKRSIFGIYLQAGLPASPTPNYVNGPLCPIQEFVLHVPAHLPKVAICPAAAATTL